LIRCTNCNTINSPDALFCTNCNSFLEWTGVKATAAEIAAAQAGVASAPPDEAADAPEVQPSPVEEAKAPEPEPEPEPEDRGASQFSALPTMRASVVLPQPRGPQNRNA